MPVRCPPWCFHRDVRKVRLEDQLIPLLVGGGVVAADAVLRIRPASGSGARCWNVCSSVVERWLCGSSEDA